MYVTRPACRLYSTITCRVQPVASWACRRHDSKMDNDDAHEKRNSVCTLLGKNLKRIRIAALMSQQDLASAAEVDRSYVSEIERGAANPSLLTLVNICHALNTTLEELVKAVDVCLDPGETIERRSNSARPKVKVPSRSRLR
jgi:transcriptional regulator with XRE-family HTH domain